MAPCKSLPLSRHFISPLPLPLLPLSHLSSSNVGSGDLNLTNHLWGSLPLGKSPAQNTYSEAAGLSASFQINILNLYCLKWNNHIKYITPVLGLDSSIECFKSAEQRQKVNLKYFVIKNEILPSLSLSPFTGHGHLVEWKEELSSIVYYGYRSFIKTFRFRPELNQKLSSRFLKFRSNSSTFGSHKVLMLRFSNLSGWFRAN